MVQAHTLTLPLLGFYGRRTQVIITYTKCRRIRRRRQQATLPIYLRLPHQYVHRLALRRTLMTRHTALTYPALCLLIAATHTCASGHETFTFEMLHDAFRDQVRTSLSAPVQVDGGGIGMVRCSRDVLFGVRPPSSSIFPCGVGEY